MDILCVLWYNSIMPNYDYSCRRCGGDFEKNVPIQNRDNIVCDCGGETFRRITFFGSVWAPSSTGSTHK